MASTVKSIVQGLKIRVTLVDECGHPRHATLHLRVALDTEDGHERIAGQDPEGHEHAERDAEQCDGGVHCPARQILPHVALGPGSHPSHTLSQRTTS